MWVIVYTFDIIYDICEYNCISLENMKSRWTIPLSTFRDTSLVKSLSFILSTGPLDYFCSTQDS